MFYSERKPQTTLQAHTFASILNQKPTQPDLVNEILSAIHYVHEYQNLVLQCTQPSGARKKYLLLNHHQCMKDL